MTTQEMMRRWVQTWKEAGPELERIRLQEARDEDNLLSLWRVSISLPGSAA